MTENQESRVSISLIEFLRSGNFGTARLGMTRQEIYELFGEPIDFHGPADKNLMEAEIWYYWPIQFYFHGDSPMWMMFTDHIQFDQWFRSKNKRVDFDAWLFSNSHRPSKKEIEAGLADLRISYKYLENETQFDGEINGRFILESGVEIWIADVCEWYGTRRRKPKRMRQRDMVVLVQNGSSENLRRYIRTAPRTPQLLVSNAYEQHSLQSDRS
mgnify:CR=1 FL=1